MSHQVDDEVSVLCVAHPQAAADRRAAAVAGLGEEFSVTTATGVEEAVTCVERVQFGETASGRDDLPEDESDTDDTTGPTRLDCVLAGYDLADGTAVELLARLAELAPRLPVVVCTASGDEAVASELISAGVTEYVPLTAESMSTGADGRPTAPEPLAAALQRAVTTARERRRAHTQTHVDRALREVHSGLVRADSRVAVEQTVVESLSESEPYLSAWIGEYDEERAVVEPRVWAGIADERFAGYTVDVSSDVPATEIAAAAIRSGQVEVADTGEAVAGLDTFEGFDERGVQSAAAVPLVSTDGDTETIHGLLGIHADRAHAFDDHERAKLAELGDTVAFALDTLAQNRELRLFRRLLDRSNDAIFVIDPEAEAFVDVNETACDRLGYDRAELLEQSPTAVVASITDPDQIVSASTVDDRARTRSGPVDAEGIDLSLSDAGDDEVDPETILQAVSQHRIVIEGTHERADGTTFPVETATTQATVDGEPYVIVISRDITGRRERERALEAQNERLEEFASVVSHDLRNPLNIATGQLELARDDVDGSVERLDRVADALDRMETLIEDLLTLARHNDDVTDPGRVSLDSVVSNCWDTVATADATLSVETSLTIRADGSRLRQVFENLFRNAVEHGGDSVTITVDELDGENGFYVADDGPGLPNDDPQRLLEAGHTTAEGGTGFGLTIVRRVVDAHDWSISVVDADDGARFEISEVTVVE